MILGHFISKFKTILFCVRISPFRTFLMASCSNLSHVSYVSGMFDLLVCILLFFYYSLTITSIKNIYKLKIRFMRDKFSIVIPVYNESANINILINEIKKSLKDYAYEIIFVDDFSSDNTGKIFLKQIDNCKCITHEKNKGQSESIKTGILNSKYNNIITIDGDLQNDPKDIPALINAYTEFKSVYLVGGIRKKRKDNFIKIISSKIANSFRQLILKDDCSDTGCGLKIFDKEIFLKLPFFNGIHRFLPALFKGFGYSTLFIKVNHRERVSGVSKYGTFDRLFRGIRDVYRVNKIIRFNRRK